MIWKKGTIQGEKAVFGYKDDVHVATALQVNGAKLRTMYELEVNGRKVMDGEMPRIFHSESSVKDYVEGALVQR